MKTGFTFKEKHSGSFGVIMKTSSRPIHPEMKSYTYETPLMDGSYDFSSANSYGREFYRCRVFTLALILHADNILSLQQKISAVSVWLTGRGILIFDDMPNVKWTASVLNSIDYAPALSGHKAALTVSFEVSPFSEALFSTSDGPAIDMQIPLETAVPIDTDETLTFSTSTIEVNNCGTWYVRPTLIYDSDGHSAYFSHLTVQCGEKTLKISGIPSSYATDKIIIDLEKQTIKNGGGMNLMEYFEGEFFELAVGQNTIDSMANLSPFKTQVIYTPKFMYDFYPEWGEENA